MTQLTQSQTDQSSKIISVAIDIGTAKAEHVIDALETIVMERSGVRPRKLAMPQMNGDSYYDVVWETMGEFAQAYALAVGPFLDDFAIDPRQRYHKLGLTTYPHLVPGATPGTRPDEDTIKVYFNDITGLVKADLLKTGLAQERLF